MTTQAKNAVNILRTRVGNLSNDEAQQVIEFIDSMTGHEPNEETIQVIRDIEAGRNLSRPYSDINEMMKDILADA